MAKKKADTLDELMEIALSSKTEYAELIFPPLSEQEADQILKSTGLDLRGSIRIIDTSGIRHAIKNHGNSIQELKRGQIAITPNDFANVIDVLSSPEIIEYVGQNRLRQDLIRYSRRLDNLLVVVEAVRTNKQGRKLVFHTMYKRN
jgi:hypothetical protein